MYTATFQGPLAAAAGPKQDPPKAAAGCTYQQADKDIKTLQNSLKTLSLLKSNPAMDPGVIDGKLGPKTVSALAAAVNYVPLLKKVPGLQAVLTLVTAFGPLLLKPDQICAVYKVLWQGCYYIIAAIAVVTVASGTTTPGAELPPSATTPTPTVANYKPGAYYRYWPKKGVYIVYQPAAGFGDPTTADPDNPGMVAVDTLYTPPAGMTAHPPIADPFYTKWWFWTLTGGGALALSTTLYFVLKK